MRSHNIYLALLASLFLLTTVILAALDQTSLRVYYTAYAMESLSITFFYGRLNPRVRANLHVVSYVIFGGFMVLAGFKVLRWLGWNLP